MPVASTDKSLPTLATELWELVRTYAREQTVDQVKGLGRYVAFGLAGSVALGLGVMLLALALLRVLQTEMASTFDENLSWAPYAITFLFCIVVIALASTRMARRNPPEGDAL